LEQNARRHNLVESGIVFIHVWSGYGQTTTAGWRLFRKITIMILNYDSKSESTNPFESDFNDSANQGIHYSKSRIAIKHIYESGFWTNRTSFQRFEQINKHSISEHLATQICNFT
jgi:hypothetical protein